MNQKAAPEIATHYYRDNFLRLCNSVEQQYGDLLSVSERAVLGSFHQLTFDAQCLYVRLISRTGPWFRESRLNYAELGPEDRAIDALLEAGFVHCAQSLTAQELASLFTQVELRHAFAEILSTGECKTKAALVCSIDALQASGEELLAIGTSIEQQRIVKPGFCDLVALLQLLFFGNRHQSMTDFATAGSGSCQLLPLFTGQCTTHVRQP